MTVVANVTDLSQARGLSFRRLSGRLRQLGRPIHSSALHALSQGERRVDADDLVALAVALGVNPNALLFPRGCPPAALVELTPATRQRAWAVWRWAAGEMPLPGELAAAGDGAAEASSQAQADFAAHASPRPGGQAAPADHKAVREARSLLDRIQAMLEVPDDPGGYRERLLRVSLERVTLEVRELILETRRAAAACGPAGSRGDGEPAITDGRRAPSSG
jgi:hypothetical protein